jgi:hypothetical protein
MNDEQQVMSTFLNREGATFGVFMFGRLKHGQEYLRRSETRFIPVASITRIVKSA